jgi:two-component system NarL family sensor kinase
MTHPAAGARSSDVVPGSDVYRVLLDHAHRGVRVQLLLRVILALIVLLSVVTVPPAHDRALCTGIAVAYLAFALVSPLWLRRRGELTARFAWLALFVDLAALAAVTVVASRSDEQSWTADVLVIGFVLVPMLATTQLRPWVCVTVAVPTVLVFLGSSIAARHANTEPWASVLLRTAVLAGLGVGSVLLSRLQRSRVLTIGRLVSDRDQLMAELLTLEERERRELSENLHDGALQYVLAARQDLDDIRDGGDAAALDRVEEALRESSQLLRSTVSQLHPAVLEQAGLLPALRDLARTTGTRGDLDIRLDAGGWPQARTSADEVLFVSARELLTNVVKHAGARSVSMRLAWQDGVAELTVADDGRGIDPAAVDGRLHDGHIGVASRRVRLEALGGRLVLCRGDAGGTVAEVRIPADLLVATAGR